jgi:hypothetical protein
MSPEIFVPHGAARVHKQQRQTARESQIADAPKAQGKNSFANRGYVAALPEQGRISKPQALRGERLIV